jgi:5'-3' exonuclease
VIKGFLDQIKSYARTFTTDKFIFCWDSKKSLRKEIYSDYKAKRRDQNQELSPEDKRWNKSCYHQFDIIRNEFLRMMGFKNIYIQPWYESDDLIAMIVKYRPQINPVIVSRDNDFYQLLGNADIFDPHTRNLITKEDFVDKYGISPSKWALVKAMAGCKSDNVVGIQGVGEPTAIKYITRNPKLKPHHKAYKKIQESRGLIDFNKRLVSLPMHGAKLYTMYKDEFNFKGFEKVSEKYNIVWSQQQYAFWRGFMKGMI